MQNVPCTNMSHSAIITRHCILFQLYRSKVEYVVKAEKLNLNKLVRFKIATSKKMSIEPPLLLTVNQKTHKWKGAHNRSLIYLCL